MTNINPEKINRARSKLKAANSIFILTGAGVSTKSGVSTFRGGGGAPVWRGMRFEQLSSTMLTLIKLGADVTFIRTGNLTF